MSPLSINKQLLLLLVGIGLGTWEALAQKDHSNDQHLRFRQNSEDPMTHLVRVSKLQKKFSWGTYKQKKFQDPWKFETEVL